MRFTHLLIAATVGAGTIWYASHTGGAATNAPPSLPASPAAPTPAKPPGAPSAAAQASVRPASAAAGAGVPRLEDHLAIFDRIDNPIMALSAFQMIESCVEFQRNEARQYDEKAGKVRPLTDAERREKADYCGHMTETMKRDRLAYLEKAVKGGAMGAAVAFIGAGPFGDPGALVTRPDDPLVKEWQKQASGYLVQGAHSGDLMALMHIHTHDGAPGVQGVSPVLQHAAGIAMMRIMTAARNGQPGFNPFDEALLQPPKTLGKDQLAAARAMADELVLAHKERSERDGRRTFLREPAPAVTGR
jgi:hypothetical protein